MLNPAMPMEFLEQAALTIVGRTPLLVVNYRYMGREGRIHVKAEHYNLTGSVKDRMALHILRKAYEQGTLKPGDPIIEVSSGNTGIAFAALGRALGHPVTIFVPEGVSPGAADLIRSLGARLKPVTREEGGFQGAVERARDLAARNPRSFLPGQFSNDENILCHREGIGPELRFQLGHLGLRPDAFVAGVGTGGTLMGVGAYLKERNSLVRVHPLEPMTERSKTGEYRKGMHRIQGLSDEFVTDLVRPGLLDAPIQVLDGDAIRLAQMLGSRLGLGVGFSSGANLLGAILVQEKMGRDAVVATLFPDDNKKYVGTDLMRPEPMNIQFVSPFIELVSYRAVRCFDLWPGDSI